MIEHLRKYTGLIILVMALVFVGLTFLGKSTSGLGRGSSDPVRLTVDGTTYTYTQFEKAGPNAYALSQSLGYPANSLGMALGLGYQPDEKEMERFIAGRQMVHKAADEFGIKPTMDEISAAVKTQSNFQTEAGGFDQAKYNALVQSEGFKRRGISEQDIFDIVRDQLTVAKLTQVLGGGLSTSRQIAADSSMIGEQRLTLQVARLPLAKFQESFKPTDDELKTEWETSKAKYMTDKMMKVSYMLAVPAYPDAPKEDEPLPPNATEEEKKAAELKKATRATEEAEAKRKINRDLGTKVGTVLEGIDKEPSNFEKLATEQGFEVKTLPDSFKVTALPPELDLKMRTGSAMTTVSSKLAQLSTSGSATNRFTEALPIDGGKYLIVRADDIEEPRVKTFEEAKEQVTKDYIEKHAQEALKKDADEKAAKIREGLTAGKSFADLAKEMDLEVKNHGPFGLRDPNATDPDAGLLFRPAAFTDPGSLADPFMQPDAALLIYVEKREIVKNDQRDSTIDMSQKRSDSALQTYAFESWLNEKLDRLASPQH